MSGQTKRRSLLKAWRDRVTKAAQAVWPAGHAPTSELVVVRATYFYNSTAPDVDNMMKPIQDALNGIVYVDDSQVADTVGRKREIGGAFVALGILPDLLARISAGKDFVHVCVERAAPENIK